MAWEEFLTNEFKQTYYVEMSGILNEVYAKQTIYPPKEDIFNAFSYTPLKQVKVVILAQDPYHQANQAHGLCFSVNPDIPFPPSLRNIFKELANDIGCETPQTGCLIKWAKQGVFQIGRASCRESV